MIKKGFILAAVLVASASCEETREEQGQSMLDYWARKEVLSTCKVDNGEWVVREGIGTIEQIQEEGPDGADIIRYHSPLVDSAFLKRPENRTPWDSFNAEQGGENIFMISFCRPQDWSEYNRIAIWVYIHPSKNPNVGMAFNLYNEGTFDTTLTPGRETNLDLEQGVWQQVFWEVDYYPRDRVTGFGIHQMLTGYDHENGEPAVTIDFASLELQKVVPDHYDGWDIQDGKIAFSHIGYRPADAKVAIAPTGSSAFSIINAKGKTVFEGQAKPVSLKGAALSILDFSAFKKTGVYRIKYGEALSEEFPIRKDVWARPLHSAVNFYFHQRCGYPVPGIHGICHQDAQGFFEEEKKAVNGGWHDAGDLSQGWWRSANACYALLSALEIENSKVIRDELAWGIDWLLKVRFHGGRHQSWIKLRQYSDNIPGTADDVVAPAEYSPWELFQGAAVFSRAIEAFPEKRTVLLAAAREDWEAAIKTHADNYLFLSWGANASARLFRETGEEKYRETAIRYADELVACQEKEYIDSLPLRGFFYNDPSHKSIVQNHHACFNEAPILALSTLCSVFPDAKEREGWLECVRLHSSFMKEGSAYSAPYNHLPAALYRRADLENDPDPAIMEQYLDGTQLSERYALRTFPIWRDHVFHGETNVQLSSSWALAEASALLGDENGMALVQEQLEWIMGRNPFSSSLMYGVGYNYSPYFVYCTHNVVGALPVGVDSFHGDAPFWNGSANATTKEIWVEPVSRFVGTLSAFLRQ